MDSKIWSNLPLSLAACVIDATMDKFTIESWCHATVNNRFLHRIALAKKYLVYSCNLTDLTTNNTTNANNAISTILRKTHGGLLPAKSISHLHLDFFSPSELVNYYTDETLVHNINNNLRQLFPLLHRLSRLSVHGFTSQCLLDNICSIPSPKFRTLLYKAAFHFRFPYDEHMISWHNLNQFQSLRTLEILGIGPDDVWSLAHAIASLSCLEHLSLGLHWIMMRKGDALLWKFAVLIQAIFPHEFPWKYSLKGNLSPTECLLPTGLKTLKIADNRGWPYHQVAPRPVNQPIKSYPVLQKLTLALEDAPSVINMISWLGQPLVSQLVICGGKEFPEDWGHSGFTSPINHLRDQSGFMSQINHLLQIYEDNKKLLLYIQNAWTTDILLADSLNKKWAGKAAITDLVLGTRASEYWINGCGPQREDKLEDHLFGRAKKGTAERFTVLTKRWGWQIERVRIERINLNQFDIQRPTGILLPCLRIIQIRPLATPWEIHAYPSSEEEFLSCLETGHAAKILAVFPSLRVITIQTHTYWVQHSEDELDEIVPEWRQRLRLWPFTEAAAIPEFEAIMSAVLRPEDIDFLNLGTCMHDDDDPETFHSIRPTRPQLRENNYMIMRFL